MYTYVYWKLSIKLGNHAYSNKSNNFNYDKNYNNSVKRRICLE